MPLGLCIYWSLSRGRGDPLHFDRLPSKWSSRGTSSGKPSVAVLKHGYIFWPLLQSGGGVYDPIPCMCLVLRLLWPGGSAGALQPAACLQKLTPKMPRCFHRVRRVQPLWNPRNTTGYKVHRPRDHHAREPTCRLCGRQSQLSPYFSQPRSPPATDHRG